MLTAIVYMYCAPNMNKLFSKKGGTRSVEWTVIFWWTATGARRWGLLQAEYGTSLIRCVCREVHWSSRVAHFGNCANIVPGFVATAVHWSGRALLDRNRLPSPKQRNKELYKILLDPYSEHYSTGHFRLELHLSYYFVYDLRRPGRPLSRRSSV